MLGDTPCIARRKENKIKTFKDPVSGVWLKKALANGIGRVNEGNFQNRKGCSSRTSEGKIKPSGEENNAPMEQMEKDEPSNMKRLFSGSR